MARPCHGLMSPLCLVALAASALLQLKPTALQGLVLMPAFTSYSRILAIAPGGEQEEIAQHQAGGNDHRKELLQPVHDRFPPSACADHPALMPNFVGVTNGLLRSWRLPLAWLAVD